MVFRAVSSRKSKGSGPGMAIAKELTEKYGGEISAYFDCQIKKVLTRIYGCTIMFALTLRIGVLCL